MKKYIKYPSYLVPLNIAKELKNIGFKDKVHFYYNLDKEYKGLYMIREAENFNKNNNISIPVWEQVFEWFRKKGLHSHIEVFYTNIKYDKKSPKIFNECKTEILEKPITLYNYFTGHKANGTFMFGISNNTITLHTKNYKSYEECRETMVNSLIKLYKNESSI